MSEADPDGRCQRKAGPIECPKCGNTEEFYRYFKAFEQIWPDGEGGYGYKDEETIEVYQIICRKCSHTDEPEKFNY